MNKRVALAAVLIVVSVVVGIFFKQRAPGWTLGPTSGAGLVLSVDPAQATARPARLEIHCDAGQTELRLYVPMRAQPPTGPGPATGRLTLDLKEQFSIGDKKTPVDDPDEQGTVTWVVADEGGYATRDDAAAFLVRMAKADWLDLGSIGFNGDSLAAATLTFAVDGLGNYRDRMATACGRPAGGP